MRENTKRAVIRVSKIFHMVVTLLLFFACWQMFYRQQTQGLFAMAAYCVLVLFFMRTYSAYQISLSKVWMLVYSQTLADAAALGTVYLLAVLERMEFFSPVPLFGLLFMQLLWNGVWSSLANTIYFHIFQPSRTIVIYRTQADLRYLEEIRRYDRKFRVEKMVDAVHAKEPMHLLNGFEAVFMIGVEEAQRNRIEKYCVEHDIRCYVMPHVGDVLMMGATHMELFSVPVFRVAHAAPNIEYAFVKRAFDMTCALLALVVFSPVMLLTAAAIRCYDGGPAIYRQVRLTRDRREFTIYKFRSMRVDAERDGIARLASEHDDRITPVGRVIRACRIDELPQLFNILRGDMSIVGPRPERPEIAAQYEKEIPSFSLRLQVRAGLTGLAQVYGRYNTDPYDKLRMDLMYINKMSLLEDIKLIFATVKILFIKESTHGVAKEQTTAAAEGVEYAIKAAK